MSIEKDQMVDSESKSMCVRTFPNSVPNQELDTHKLWKRSKELITTHYLIQAMIFLPDLDPVTIKKSYQ